MDELGQQLAQAASSAVESERRRIYFQLGGGALAIGLLVAGWLLVMRLADHGLRMRKELDKVERDLDIAREIQRGLLPRDIPDTPGFEVEGWSQPADQTGGDYFDWMKLPDGGTLITLADVTGHGIGPALIVAVCRAYMRAAAAGNGVALEAAIARVNDLLQMDIPDERFVTAAVGVLRPESNQMSLVSAGQAPLFFYRAASRTVENWAAADVPLGVMSGVTRWCSQRTDFLNGRIQAASNSASRGSKLSSRRTRRSRRRTLFARCTLTSSPTQLARRNQTT